MLLIDIVYISRMPTNYNPDTVDTVSTLFYSYLYLQATSKLFILFPVFKTKF